MGDVFLIAREAIQGFCADLVDFSAGHGDQKRLQAGPIDQR
nr:MULTISPECIES: hypothetical protein [Brevundimonas]